MPLHIAVAPCPSRISYYANVVCVDVPGAAWNEPTFALNADVKAKIESETRDAGEEKQQPLPTATATASATTTATFTATYSHN